MTERRYAMTKVSAGDYLLPSNDAQTLWRIRTYEDGPSHGLEDWPRDREFWGTWRWLGPLDAIDVDDWERWEAVDAYCATRAEAIKAALR